MHCIHTRRSLLTATPAIVTLPALAATLSSSLRASAAPLRGPTPQAAARLDEALAEAVAGGLPGVAVQVDDAGATIYTGVAGVASIEAGTPLAITDKFRIYSITKTFTAIVTLQLADEGILSLDDTVTQWLTGPPVSAIPHIDRITPRQLLTHSSGIYDYAEGPSTVFFADAFTGPDADWTRVWTPNEVLAYVDGAKEEPFFLPGEGVYYSNSNYILLGLIIEAATGQTFAAELSDRILIPLGLADTSLEMGSALPDDLVDGYQVLDGQMFNVSTVNLSWAWAAGGIVSTASDLARFAGAVFSSELLSAEAHAEMFTLAPEAWAGHRFGMGVYQMETANGPLIGMDGGGAGGNAAMLRLANRDLTVVALANIDPSGIYAIVDEAVSWALSRPRPS